MGTLLYTAILSLYTRRHHTTRHKMPKGSGLTKPLALSPELADIVGAKTWEQLSRPEVVKRIWAYLKAHKLQDPENKQYFKPDAKMKPIFGEDKVRAFGMAKFLKTHQNHPGNCPLLRPSNLHKTCPWSTCPAHRHASACIAPQQELAHWQLGVFCCSHRSPG